MQAAKTFARWRRYLIRWLTIAAQVTMTDRPEPDQNEYRDQQPEGSGIENEPTGQSGDTKPAGEWDQETEFEELDVDTPGTSQAGSTGQSDSPGDTGAVADQDGSPLLTLGDTESFEIQVVEDKLRVEPQNNGTYRIFMGDEKIAVVYPQSADDQVVWESLDQIDEGFLQQIGELISEHHMK